MALEIGKRYHGFLLEEKCEVREIGAQAHRFVHEKSGARLLYLETEDDNKVFSITFRTPPEDSTGVAHIVEHSVLCGSRKFPLKEPFVELVKGSLNTYLNAMTFPDKTMYPVASRNDKDFQNLMDVYLDAVFYPCMYECPEILMQEGWHYALDEADALSYRGVVYNEMKGAFSSPEAVLDKEILEALFPDTTYGCESGGDPEAIVELTQEAFLAFHRRFYHPSNSYIYLYGAMDIEEKLAFLDEAYLRAFERKAVDSAVARQPLFARPKEVTAAYSVASGERTEDKTFLSWNCIAGDALDAEKMLALQILEHFLLRTQAAPLKKALIDAGVGKDVMSSFSESLLQPTFSIIVGGANETQAEKFRAVVRETLEKLAAEGIARRLIEASINLLEFRLREADYGHSPKGLVYSIKLMNSWLYDGDPLLYLRYEPLLAKIKAGLDARYFEKLIETCLLQNPHVAFVTLRPEPGMADKRAAEIKAQLAAYKASLSPEEIERLRADEARLAARQEAEDTPEALQAIPLLRLSDIAPQSEQLIGEKRALDGLDVLLHPVQTNGIVYLNLYFDLAPLDEAEVLYAYLLAELLGKVATERYSYEELANEIYLQTGGIGYEVLAFTMNGDADAYAPRLKVKSKALAEKASALCALLAEILTRSRFDDKKRIKELVEQIKSSLETYLLRNAQQVVAGRVLSYFSPSGKYNEQGMLSFYEFVSALAGQFDARFESLTAKLTALAGMIFRRQDFLASVTAQAEDYGRFAEAFAPLSGALATKAYPAKPRAFAVARRNEGLMTSSKIQYVAKGANFLRLGYAYSGSMKVLETILRYDYFWTRIRVQGGAYGAFTQFRRNGNMLFGSYRDPNLAETVRVYDETSAFLRAFDVSEREMLKYIIGTISTVDTPLTPQMKGEVAAECYIRGISQADIQAERDQILATRQADIRALAALIEACMQEQYLCVLGGEERIRENKALFGEIKQVFD